MGEAKQKKARARGRSWATGGITVMANDVECFRWSCIEQEAKRQIKGEETCVKKQTI